MNKFFIKSLTLFILIIVLIIPLQMINSLVGERQARYEKLTNKIKNIWGGPQNLEGIYLITNKGIFLPEQTDITGNISTSIRKKGIFKIPLYTSNLDLSVTFPNETKSANFSKIVIALSDPNSIEISKIIWDGNKINPTINTDKNRVKISIPNNKIKNKCNIKLQCKISGLKELIFSQFSKNQNVNIKSDWKDPNFIGNYLPSKRDISSKGFSAIWNIKQKFNLYYKNEITAISDLKYRSSEESYGVSLFIPTNIYLLTERSIKYAFLFIFLTFITFITIEFSNKLKVHPIQYSLIGSAMVIFYLLLLSLSEHLYFSLSYFIATTATISLISLYSYKIIKDRIKVSIIFTMLSILYLFLYILLQLEVYALIVGSLSLFMILTLIMYLTRNIDWYKLFTLETKPAPKKLK